MDYYRRALEFKGRGTTSAIITAYLNLGALLQEQGDLDTAQGFLMKAVEELTEVSGRGHSLIEAYTSLALVSMKRGEFHSAQQLLGKAEELWQKRGPRQFEFLRALTTDK